jgi:hypothetical protein
MTLAFGEPSHPKVSKRNLKKLCAFILKTPTQYQ